MTLPIYESTGPVMSPAYSAVLVPDGQCGSRGVVKAFCISRKKSSCKRAHVTFGFLGAT